jgi:hypothetical protein
MHGTHESYVHWVLLFPANEQAILYNMYYHHLFLYKDRRDPNVLGVELLEDSCIRRCFASTIYVVYIIW